MALLVAGVAFDAYEIILRDKPAAMLAVSPKGTVPVLVQPGGQVLEQSWDIVEWALTHGQASAAVQDWWSRAQTQDNLDLLRCNDGDFKYHLDRYKYPQRFEVKHDDPVSDPRIDHRNQAVAGLLQRLEQHLAESKFLGGTKPCATDFCIFPFVRQFAAVEPAWFDALPLTGVHRWLAHWLQSPLFAACMQKLPSNVSGPFDMRPAL